MDLNLSECCFERTFGGQHYHVISGHRQVQNVHVERLFPPGTPAMWCKAKVVEYRGLELPDDRGSEPAAVALTADQGTPADPGPTTDTEEEGEFEYTAIPQDVEPRRNVNLQRHGTSHAHKHTHTHSLGRTENQARTHTHTHTHTLCVQNAQLDRE